jgi:hypothetical protein
MATNPIPSLPTPDPSQPERPLTRDETWELIFSLYGSAREMYAEVGGAEAWIKAERAAWAEESSR